MNALRARNIATVPLPRTFTTAERRRIVTDAFVKFGDQRLSSLREVEHTHPDLLDRQSTNRTILSIAVKALAGAGDPTENTVGAVRGKLEMSPDDVDKAFCYCVNGADMSGHDAAARMGQLG